MITETIFVISTISIGILFIIINRRIRKFNPMSLEEIKSNWTKTDNIIYGDNAFDVKLKSLESSKTKVIAKQ